MRLFDYPETDSRYVEFQDHPSVDTLGPDIRLDLDGQGAVGLDIDHASRSLDLSILETRGLPPVAAHEPGPAGADRLPGGLSGAAPRAGRSGAGGPPRSRRGGRRRG